jgi:hypothetical protein
VAAASTGCAGRARWLHLLPSIGEVETAEDRSAPLQRIQGSSELKQAIEGVETAHRNRGG